MEPAAPPVQPAAALLALAPPPAAAFSAEQIAAGDRLAVRLWSSFTFVSSSAMLGIGAWLKPDAAGTGTHQQLGLPPCGWLHMTGCPCPMCGCTTAVSHFAHGQFLASFLTQPFGFAVGLLAAVLIPLTVIGILRGKWVGPSMFTLNWHWRSLVFGGLGFMLLAAGSTKIIIVRAGITFF